MYVPSTLHVPCALVKLQMYAKNMRTDANTPALHPLLKLPFLRATSGSDKDVIGLVYCTSTSKLTLSSASRFSETYLRCWKWQWKTIDAVIIKALDPDSKNNIHVTLTYPDQMGPTPSWICEIFVYVK